MWLQKAVRNAMKAYPTEFRWAAEWLNQTLLDMTKTPVLEWKAQRKNLRAETVQSKAL